MKHNFLIFAFALLLLYLSLEGGVGVDRKYVKVCQHYSDGESVKIPNGQDCTSFYICKKHVPILTPCLSETILNYQGSKRTKCIPSEDPNKCPQKDDPSFLDNALKELSSRNKKS